MKAIFKVKTLDRDTRIEYPASDVAVEVSDAFAARLMAHPQHGELFEVEGMAKSNHKAENEDSLIDNELDSDKPKRGRKTKDD